MRCSLTLACKACSFRHGLTGILQAWRRSLVPRDIDLHGGRPSYGSLLVCANVSVSHARCVLLVPDAQNATILLPSVRSSKRWFLHQGVVTLQAHQRSLRGFVIDRVAGC